MPIIKRNAKGEVTTHVVVQNSAPRPVMREFPAFDGLKPGMSIKEAQEYSSKHGNCSPDSMSTEAIIKLVRTPYPGYAAKDAANLRKVTIKSPLTAVRAHCMSCRGSAKEVRLCECINCPLWLFRMGKRPNTSR